MDLDKDLAFGRLLVLLRQLEHEHGGRYGWQSQVARAFGHKWPTLVNKWMKGSRDGASIETLMGIQKAMRLNQRFFWDPGLGDDPDYRQWTTREVAADDGEVNRLDMGRLDTATTPRVVIDFLATGQMAPVTQDEIAAMVAYVQSARGGAASGGSPNLARFLRTFRSDSEPEQAAPSSLNTTVDAESKLTQLHVPKRR